MKRPVVAGIGELLWDVLPDGEVLGGAPVNFCYHVNALGAVGVPISTIGKDERGSRATEILKTKGLEVSAISLHDHHPTGYVTVQLDSQGGASYVFSEKAAWDHLTINDTALELQQNLNAICFGTLAQRGDDSRRAILEYIDSLPKEVVRVFDINLRGDFYATDIITNSLQRTDILKLSIEELEILRELYDGDIEEQAFLQSLLNEYGLTMIVLTRGGEGSVLLTGDELSDHLGEQTSVVDTIGAGDSFTAAVVTGHLLGFELKKIHRKAAEVAAYVCSQRGAMPVLPREMAIIP